MSNYPDDIARHDDNPQSPNYEERDYKCKSCGEPMDFKFQLDQNGRCIDCIDDDSVDNYD